MQREQSSNNATIKRTRKAMMKMKPTMRGNEKDFILSMGPIYGGTTPTQTADSSQTNQQSSGTPTTDTGSGGQTGDDTSGGGSAPKTETDPAEKFVNDPKAISQLLKQVGDLQKNLEAVTEKNTQYETEKQKAERATQTREQQLETDLANSQAVIEKMDRVLRTVAVQNAFLSAGDYQWNSVRQAMSELDEAAYDIDVDLDGGKATVNGIENEVKRIAQACPWLLKNQAEGDPPANGRQRKTATGMPPAPPNPNAGKLGKREDLMKRFPAIVAK